MRSPEKQVNMNFRLCCVEYYDSMYYVTKISFVKAIKLTFTVYFISCIVVLTRMLARGYFNYHHNKRREETSVVVIVLLLH